MSKGNPNGRKKGISTDKMLCDLPKESKILYIAAIWSGKTRKDLADALDFNSIPNLMDKMKRGSLKQDQIDILKQEIGLDIKEFCREMKREWVKLGEIK